MLRSRQQRTLARIFAKPTPSDLRWVEVVSLMRALDVAISERAGSRVRFEKDGVRLVVHRPHPGPNLGKGLVLQVAEFLDDIGVKP